MILMQRKEGETHLQNNKVHTRSHTGYIAVTAIEGEWLKQPNDHLSSWNVSSFK